MNDTNRVIYREASGENQPIKYHVIGMNDWGFFDSLVEFFQKNYGATVEVKSDGINTRCWQLRARGEYFMLEHNEDLGNWFYSCGSEGDSALMQAIADDLEGRLKDIPCQ